MSIAVRTSKSNIPNPAMKMEEPVFLKAHAHRNIEGEAPDAGYARSEAPEVGSCRREEPDAGYTYNESQAYHGRSRS